MQIEAAARGDVEDRLRQDQAIGDDDDGLGSERGESRRRLGPAQARGRQDGQAKAQRRGVDGRGRWLEAAPAAGLWRARINGRDLVALGRRFR